MQNISKAEETAKRLLELGAALGRRHSLRDPMAKAVEEMALTPTQFHAHLWLGLDGPLTMGELARRLGVTEKTITGIVDRLEKKGLAERGRLASDRRVVEASLTEKGRDLWVQMDAQILERTTCLLSVLPEEDRLALLRVMERLVDHFTAEEGES